MATCVRSAWLDLTGDGTITVPLESPAGGWFCQSLDLGYPVVREVVANRPDQDGVDDRTQYMGSRVVTADITALAGAGAQIDAVAAQFARFMQPSARPVLHYILDRPGAAERTLVLRGSGYTWPIAGPSQRDIQLQFVAADPVSRSPTMQTATAYAGAPGGGRVYPLTFNRTYPAGGSSATTATITSGGDVAIRPTLRIYGPITAPEVNLFPFPAGPAFVVMFLGSFHIDAGHFVDIDTAHKTAWTDGDPTQSVLASIDWINSRWYPLPVSPGYTQMTLTGGNTSGVTQVVASWQDGYLS
jgi:hypothetical protein